MALEADDPRIREHYQKIRSGEEDWVILGYGGTRNVVSYELSGKSVENIEKELKGPANYVYLRVPDTNTFVLGCFLAPEAGSVMKAKMAVHKSSISDIFHFVHLVFQSSSVSDFSESSIKQKVEDGPLERPRDDLDPSSSNSSRTREPRQPRVETPKPEPPKENLKVEPPKEEPPKEEPPKEEPPKEEPPKEEPPKEEPPKEEALKEEPPKEEPPKEEPPKEEPPKEEAREEEAPKEEAPKEEAPKEEAPKEEAREEEAPKEETPKVEPPNEEAPKEETPKEEPTKEEPKVEVPKEEPKIETKVEAPKAEPVKEQPKTEASKSFTPPAFTPSTTKKTEDDDLFEQLTEEELNQLANEAEKITNKSTEKSPLRPMPTQVYADDPEKEARRKKSTEETLVLIDKIQNNSKEIPVVLNLSHHEFLSEELIEKLGIALAENTVVNELILANVNMSSNGCAILIHYIKENKTIFHINLESNCIGGEGFEAIAEYLNVTTTLKELRLTNQRTTLSGKSEKIFVKAVEQNTSLQKLGVTSKDQTTRNALDKFIFRNKDLARQKRVAEQKAKK